MKASSQQQQALASITQASTSTKYDRVCPSSTRRWNIPAHPPTTRSMTIVPPRYWETNGMIANGTRMDFSCTWQENMKKVMEMQLNPITRTLLVGLSSNAAMEGRLNPKHRAKHSIVSTGLDSQLCHFITTSEMHQKLGTLSWYRPRWMGNMAWSTELNDQPDPSHGSHSRRVVTVTMMAQYMHSPIIFSLRLRPNFLAVMPTSPARKARLKQTDISLALMARVYTKQHRYLLPVIMKQNAYKMSPNIRQLYWKCPWSIRIKSGLISMMKMEALNKYLLRYLRGEHSWATKYIAGIRNRQSTRITVARIKAIKLALSYPSWTNRD